MANHLSNMFMVYSTNKQRGRLQTNYPESNLSKDSPDFDLLARIMVHHVGGGPISELGGWGYGGDQGFPNKALLRSPYRVVSLIGTLEHKVPYKA